MTQRQTRSAYVPRTYWEQVADQLAEGDQLAGRDRDAIVRATHDTAFYLRKHQLFTEQLLTPAIENAHQILEVGCGPGGNLAWLVNRGKNVAGVDISPRMLALAKRRLPDVPLILIDGARLPFADQGFESVMTVTVLQHNPVPQAVALLSEVARVAACEVHIFEDTAWISIRDRRSHWSRPPGWYVRQMAAAGLELVAQERMAVAAQEVAVALARAALGRGQGEGAPLAERRARFESAACGAARLVDAVLPAAVGLTRMSFRRP